MKWSDFYGYMAAKDNDADWLAFMQDWLNMDMDRYGRGVHDMSSELRAGQRVMNALHRVRPDLYDWATATIFDPFYVDGRLQEFGDRIYNEWIKRLLG